MTVSSRALVELVLLGPTNDRRQLQDSPVLGDVWIAYAMKPHDAIDLLITPHKTRPAGPVAAGPAARSDSVKMTGDGLLATFDGPAPSNPAVSSEIRCAR